jgi:hypothetical protein
MDGRRRDILGAVLLGSAATRDFNGDFAGGTGAVVELRGRDAGVKVSPWTLEPSALGGTGPQPSVSACVGLVGPQPGAARDAGVDVLSLTPQPSALAGTGPQPSVSACVDLVGPQPGAARDAGVDVLSLTPQPSALGGTGPQSGAVPHPFLEVPCCHTWPRDTLFGLW